MCRHLRWGGGPPKFSTIMTSFTSHETYDIGVKRLATVESCTHGIGLYAVCAGVERIHTVLQYTEVQLSPAPLSRVGLRNNQLRLSHCRLIRDLGRCKSLAFPNKAPWPK